MVNIKDANFITIKNISSENISIKTQASTTLVGWESEVIVPRKKSVTFAKRKIADWDDILLLQSKGLIEATGAIDYPWGDTALVEPPEIIEISRFELMEI